MAQEVEWRREAEARWRREWEEAKRDEQAQHDTAPYTIIYGHHIWPAGNPMPPSCNPMQAQQAAAALLDSSNQAPLA